MATFIAMTTHNYQTSGMNIIVAVGHDENKVRQHAEAKLSEHLATSVGTDIYADTELKNLVIASKTKAKKLYGFDLSDYNMNANMYEDSTGYDWVS